MSTVLFNNGLGSHRSFGYGRAAVSFDGSELTNSRGFWLPFEAKLGIGGVRFQNLTSVPITVEQTLEITPDDITDDPTLRNIWGPVITGLAVRDTHLIMPPMTGFRITLVPAAATVITAMSWLAGVVTVSSTAHGLQSGYTATIAGVTPAGYNGTYVVTVTDANTFTYALAADPGAVTVQGTVRVKGTGSVVFLST